MNSLTHFEIKFRSHLRMSMKFNTKQRNLHFQFISLDESSFILTNITKIGQLFFDESFQIIKGILESLLVVRN